MRSSRSLGSWVFGLGLLGFGAVLLAAGVTSSQQVGIIVGPALMVLAAAGLVASAPARPGRGVRLEAGPSLRIRLRPHRPLAVLLIGLALTWVVASGMLAIGLGEGGLLLLPALLVVAVVVPDSLRALLRGAHLRFTADAVLLHGWGTDASLAWEDVAAVEICTDNPRRPTVRFTGRPGAPSFAWQPRRLVLPLDLRPASPLLDVLLLGLEGPGRVQVLGERLAAAPRADRTALLDEQGVTFLDRTM